jgi:hypothetical protein
MKLPFTVCLLLSTLASSGQQKTIETQTIAWAGYYQRLHINERLSVHTEVEGRWFAPAMRQHQWVLPRIHVHYLIATGVDLSAGGTYFRHALPQSDDPVLLVRPEWRAHQELSFKQSINSTPVWLEHRYRLEERFMQKVKDNVMAQGWDFGWRFRYRVQLVVPLLPRAKLSPALKIYDEIMLNAGKTIQHNIFDQNRMGIALALEFSNALTADIGYMHWFQQRPAGNAFYNRHMLRLTLHHTLFLANQYDTRSVHHPGGYPGSRGTFCY